MGSLYRQQVEFVLVMKRGTGWHINNVALGRHGRNRTTIWSAPGLNGFGRDRQEMLALHPTVKPVGLIADADRDEDAPAGDWTLFDTGHCREGRGGCAPLYGSARPRRGAVHRR
ncbi:MULTISPECIES: hypothetical protein [unclassified Methylobacterium]|uniref:hypothetical protein n=1 Tax=unclassified Methylobacterium TaxID=2615210 RepID=UPI00226A6879|nr:MULTISPECIES: hypothetical protein [unclassified Methylobacterium]